MLFVFMVASIYMTIRAGYSKLCFKKESVVTSITFCILNYKFMRRKKDITDKIYSLMYTI